MASEKFGLLNAKEEGTRLKGEIVESPEKLQVTLLSAEGPPTCRTVLLLF